jgi:tripartite-type tricarboxylate transporter receptor subunit TctC
MMKRARRVVLGAVLLSISAAAFAQGAWPSHPIKMIVPFAPGGASDFVARIISQPLSDALGQQIVVDNRAGASGNIGMEVAARAAPDGYTVFLGNIGTVAINPGVFKTMPIDTQRDLVPVSLVAEVPSILVVNPELPVDTVADLVRLAKSKPGKLNFASPGPSTLNRLEMEQFMKDAGLSIMHVPYKGGAGPAVLALLANETQVAFITLSSAMAQVQANRLRPLAVTSSSRVEGLSKVATMVESGYPDMVSTSWQGVFVPAGTPRSVVMRLHKALIKVLSSSDVEKKLTAGGVSVVQSASPDDFAGFVGTEIVRWGRVARESGATAE